MVPFRSNTGLAVIVTGLLAGCGPVETVFFGGAPSGHEFVREFADTAVVRNIETDSTVAEGVRWATYAGVRSLRAGRTEIGSRLQALAVQYAPDVPDSLLEADPALDLWNRLAAQNVVQRMDIMRSDALTIQAVAIDTLTLSMEMDSTMVEHRWVAVVSRGRAWLDPTAGLREDVR